MISLIVRDKVWIEHGKIFQNYAYEQTDEKRIMSHMVLKTPKETEKLLLLCLKKRLTFLGLPLKR